MESADKPGSVESNHSSGAAVTDNLKRPTRKHPRARYTLPYLVLLRVGFTVPRRVTTRAVRSYRTFSPLPRLVLRQGRRYIFCGTFRRLTPPRRYLALCPSGARTFLPLARAIAWPTPGATLALSRAGRNPQAPTSAVSRAVLSARKPNSPQRRPGSQRLIRSPKQAAARGKALAATLRSRSEKVFPREAVS